MRAAYGTYVPQGQAAKKSRDSALRSWRAPPTVALYSAGTVRLAIGQAGADGRVLAETMACSRSSLHSQGHDQLLVEGSK